MTTIAYKVKLHPGQPLTPEQLELVKDRPHVLEAILKSIADEGSTASGILIKFDVHSKNLDIPYGGSTNIVFEMLLRMLALGFIKSELVKA